MAETFTVFVDPNFDAVQRRAIGSAVVDYIVTRTQEGRGINNQPFTSRTGGAAYSEAYQQHRDFDVGGKLPSPINLTLTGDMLSSIEVIDISLAGKIVVGIQDGENAQKAIWMREKGYNFLGLSQSEQNTVLAQFSRLTPSDIAKAQIVEDVANDILKGIFRG